MPSEQEAHSSVIYGGAVWHILRMRRVFLFGQPSQILDDYTPFRHNLRPTNLGRVSVCLPVFAHHRLKASK